MISNEDGYKYNGVRYRLSISDMRKCLLETHETATHPEISDRTAEIFFCPSVFFFLDWFVRNLISKDMCDL